MNRELKTSEAKKCRETANSSKKYVRYIEGCEMYSMGMTNIDAFLDADQSAEQDQKKEKEKEATR